ncbi:skin secretory protein xP2-like [Triticum dicoccoides]|uniref:skin secretory protein xP2-like n=1 Tax=Triticum dicoccoides TaxID=85692 RepID=UPI00189150A7|nr:skin secretory protein xP2-like [Triticum dicoccoides]
MSSSPTNNVEEDAWLMRIELKREELEEIFKEDKSKEVVGDQTPAVEPALPVEKEEDVLQPYYEYLTPTEIEAFRIIEMRKGPRGGPAPPPTRTWYWFHPLPAEAAGADNADDPLAAGNADHPDPLPVEAADANNPDLILADADAEDEDEADNNDHLDHPLGAEAADGDHPDLPLGGEEADGDHHDLPLPAEEVDGDHHDLPLPAEEANGDHHDLPLAAEEADSDQHDLPLAAEEADGDHHNLPLADADADAEEDAEAEAGADDPAELPAGPDAAAPPDAPPAAALLGPLPEPSSPLAYHPAAMPLEEFDQWGAPSIWRQRRRTTMTTSRRVQRSPDSSPLQKFSPLRNDDSRTERLLLACR